MINHFELLEGATVSLRFVYDVSQRQRFRNLELIEEWYSKYNGILFDDVDYEIVTRTQHQRNYHFLEWASAVMLYETTGFMTLLEKYEIVTKHKMKNQILRSIMPTEIYEYIIGNGTGLPDIFAYNINKNCKYWFFCEIKGKDSLSDKQVQRINDLYNFTKKPVYILEMLELKYSQC